jgi:hypothetical protein
MALMKINTSSMLIFSFYYYILEGNQVMGFFDWKKILSILSTPQFLYYSSYYI